MKQTIATESLNATPPTAVVVATMVAGVSLNEWVAIATLTYIAAQLGYLVWKWFREYKNGRPGRPHTRRKEDE